MPAVFLNVDLSPAASSQDGRARSTRPRARPTTRWDSRDTRCCLTRSSADRYAVVYHFHVGKRIVLLHWLCCGRDWPQQLVVDMCCILMRLAHLCASFLCSSWVFL